MIVPMLKYTFLVFHNEYHSFLENLQELGVVHVVQKTVRANEVLKDKHAEIKNIEKVIQFLSTRKSSDTETKIELIEAELLDSISAKRQELEELEIQLDEYQKDYEKAKLWGNFSQELLDKLKANNIHIKLYSTTKKEFLKIEKSEVPVEMIYQSGNHIFFAGIEVGETQHNFDAQEVSFPKKTYTEIEKEIVQVKSEMELMNSYFEKYSYDAIQNLESYKLSLFQSLQFEEIKTNTTSGANNKLMILEGWVPNSKDISLKRFLEKSNILFVTGKATPRDNIPVLLKNNRFSSLFEPIGTMFSLPDYTELDLTVFFAPFFMFFFGFCLGDAGYGLLFVIGAGIYKLKASKAVKPYLSLIQFLGLATILFGTISGTFFGVNLIETEISLTDRFRNLFLNPDRMFNLALILGGIQIIFGMCIKAANQIKQFGFQYALSTFGWLIILLGSVIYSLLVGNGTISKNSNILYVIITLGGFFVLFFSDPSVNVFARVGKGVWDIYSTVTGIFGDLLSYIRLFALGLSSAILGFVINDIGLQILGASKIIGPIFFAIFLILGHTLNILISSLGSFVHPMRLTFVEFYKSAGFMGGGKAYKPFSNKIQNT